ncbi:hypothetical protein BT69DRAFT_1338529 [Atractiella rhizophila]|nr:hypothetical protein BT69DRAFT_1338529 [Atractiella rhizophila]
MKSLPTPVQAFFVGLNLPPPSAPIPSPEIFFSIPSTPLTTKAITLIEHLLPTWAVNHCYRTFCYAIAIASKGGWDKPPLAEQLGWDREAIFLACVMHDIGWDQNAHIQEDGVGSKLSFEIFGGIKAREALLKWGAGREMADEVCEAIIRHTDMAEGLGTIRLLLACVQLGASHDILGWALTAPIIIHPLDQEYIVKVYPRLGFTEELHRIIHTEWTNKPGCLFEKAKPVFNKLFEEKERLKAADGERENVGKEEEWKKRRARVDLDAITLDGVGF